MADRFAEHSAQLPPSYVQFMEVRNGWEGDLGDDFGYVVIWTRESLDDRYNGYEMAKYLDHRWFPFGSDGGGEMLCFDLKSEDDKVFLLPYIGMSDETPLSLCDSFTAVASAVSKIT